MKKRKSIFYLLVIFVSLGCLLFWYGNLHKILAPFLSISPNNKSTVAPTPHEETPKTKNIDKASETDTRQYKKIAIPKEEATITGDNKSPLPASPPLPKISPESSQAERRQTVGFKDSVDYIVRADEPFEVAGKTFTINEIRDKLHLEEIKEPQLSQITETDVGSSLRKPIPGQAADGRRAAEYYAVRVVLPGENLWNIHYQIVKEYLARRHIILAPHADEPYPNGVSSGIGRLLKFIEGVVFVYNLRTNRLEKNLNLIYPQEIVVFFKISDLFAALDQLQPQDLNRLRYVNNFLKLERPSGASELLDRRNLLE